MSAKGEFFKAKIRTAALNAVRDGVEVSAKRLANEYQKRLQSRKSSLDYRVRTRNTSKGAAKVQPIQNLGSRLSTWQASIQLHRQSDSVRIKVDESQLETSKPKARVGTNAVYAPPLEYGSRRNAPHPFMRPTLVNSKTELAELFQKKVFASFRRYMR